MKTHPMKFLLVTFLIASTSLLYGQNAAHVIKESLQPLDSMNDDQAIIKYKEALNLDASNVYLLSKCSELCSRIGGRLKEDKPRQEDFYTAAKTYARAALRVNPLYSDANFVMALVMGREAMREGGKNKIEAVKDIKKYADLALKYDPRNFKAWFVLGKWYYEMGNLNYLERTAVKLLYGSLPAATLQDAIHCFEKVKALNPGFVLNYLSLAKAYKKKNEEDMAKEILAVMFNLPDKTQDDEKYKREGRDLLKKWE